MLKRYLLPLLFLLLLGLLECGGSSGTVTIAAARGSLSGAAQLSVQ